MHPSAMQLPTLQKEYPGLQSLIFGAFGFPLGLTVIIIVGGDLFTSNCSYMMAALHEGKVTLRHLVQVG